MKNDKTDGGTGNRLLAALIPLMAVCCLGPVLALTFFSTTVAWITSINGWDLAIVVLLAFSVARAIFHYRILGNQCPAKPKSTRVIQPEISGLPKPYHKTTQ
jgi:membrane protein implicated in regulation of membrane protease activity